MQAAGKPRRAALAVITLAVVVVSSVIVLPLLGWAFDAWATRQFDARDWQLIKSGAPEATMNPRWSIVFVMPPFDGWYPWRPFRGLA